ncbi:MAG: methionyl-tRNA formyltransferase [Christensenellales bacterium]|jgi:methionyl-tRNA formyltransferase
MRIVFMGTPEFAVPSLDKMVSEGFDVVACFTQPDRPAGRGNKLTPCPVKQSAQAHGIDVFQFERVRRQAGLDAIRACKPDLIVTAAFGQILSQKILDVPPMGVVNVHASLLPKYRGPAPINRAIMAGESVTGITTMFTDIGIDTGDCILFRELEILPLETAGELSERLSVLGGETLIETLRLLQKGECPRIPQNESKASYQGMLTKELGEIDFTKSAREIEWLVRGLNPWPGAYTTFSDGTLKIWLARATDEYAGNPGEVVLSSPKRGLFVACGGDAIEILEMQAPSAKRMQAKQYLVGKPIAEGTVFGAKEEA